MKPKHEPNKLGFFEPTNTRTAQHQAAAPHSLTGALDKPTTTLPPSGFVPQFRQLNATLCLFMSLALMVRISSAASRIQHWEVREPNSGELVGGMTTALHSFARIQNTYERFIDRLKLPATIDGAWIGPSFGPIPNATYVQTQGSPYMVNTNNELGAPKIVDAAELLVHRLVEGAAITTGVSVMSHQLKIATLNLNAGADLSSGFSYFIFALVGMGGLAALIAVSYKYCFKRYNAQSPVILENNPDVELGEQSPEGPSGPTV